MSKPRARRSEDRRTTRDRGPEDRGDGGWRARWSELKGPDGENGWRQRGRKFVRRFREPLIGAAVAGVAAPVAAAAVNATEQQRAARAATEDQLADVVGQRWAEARQERIRENTIQGAMLRYDISRDLAADIFDIAQQEGIEPDIAYGLVKTESSFRPAVESWAGAIGLTQLMPETARWLKPGTTIEELTDPEYNLHLGFSYLNDLINKYNGDLRLALLAYNRGPGTVDGILERGGDPSNGYAEKVMSG